MAAVKGKKQVILFGATEATDLATAETAATLKLPCMLTSFTPYEESRSETTDDAVYCTSSDSFVKKDTGEIEISAMSLTGLSDKDDPDYVATMAALKTMHRNDTRGCFVITHPNGTDKQWANMKLLKVRGDIAEGAPDDKIKFIIEVQLHSLPASA